MIKILARKQSAPALILAGLLAAGAAPLQAADATDPAIADQVRQELIRLLNEEGMLDEAIERGIGNYIEKQRELARAQKEAEEARKAAALRPVDPKRDYILGDPSAPITLVEYSDFECPFCKRFHPTVKQLLANNPDKVNWVYRHFPLGFHNPGAQKQAEGAECAGELGGGEAYWQFTDIIYERTKSNGKGFPIEHLTPLAKEIGLDADKFQECLETGRMEARVKEDYQNGVASGVSGTPGVILVHHESGRLKPLAGAVPLANLQAAVDSLLEE